MEKFLIGESIVWEADIAEVDVSDLDQGRILVVLKNGKFFSVENQQALDVVMRYCPRAVEGRRLRWARGAWAFHNLVAHPVLQILHWAGMTKLGLRVHDATIPRPRTRAK